MSGGKDFYSSFGFFQAINPDITTDTNVVTGNPIDVRNYGGCTLVITINSFASAGDNGTNAAWFVLQYGYSNPAVITWSNVHNSLIIHDVYGGYDSTASTGRFFNLESKTSLLGSDNVTASATGGYGRLIVGYKKPVGNNNSTHRWVRVFMSLSGNASTMWLAAVAVCGSPNNWAVNSPI